MLWIVLGGLVALYGLVAFLVDAGKALKHHAVGDALYVLGAELVTFAIGGVIVVSTGMRLFS